MEKKNYNFFQFININLIKLICLLNSMKEMMSMMIITIKKSIKNYSINRVLEKNLFAEAFIIMMFQLFY